MTTIGEDQLQDRLDRVTAERDEAQHAVEYLTRVRFVELAEASGLRAAAIERAEKAEAERDSARNYAAELRLMEKSAEDRRVSEVDALRAQVAQLRVALEKVSWGSLPIIRANGCRECHSIAIGRHEDGCVVGAALVASAPKEKGSISNG